MKRRLWQVVIVAVLVAAGWLAWRVLFPSQERIIRKRLTELAEVASFSKEGPLAQVINVEKFGSFFGPEVIINMDVRGSSRQSVAGREALLTAMRAARVTVGWLTVTFLDVGVVLGADKTSAMVNLTAQAKWPGDFQVQELQLTMRKIDGDWVIIRVETVKTLSIQPRHRCWPLVFAVMG